MHNISKIICIVTNKSEIYIVYILLSTLLINNFQISRATTLEFYLKHV